MRTLLIFLIFFCFLNRLVAQEFSNCLIDFESLLPPEPIDIKDNNLLRTFNSSRVLNPLVGHDSELVNLIWYKYVRDADIKEQKAYLNKLKTIRTQLIRSFGVEERVKVTLPMEFQDTNHVIKLNRIYERVKNKHNLNVPMIFYNDMNLLDGRNQSSYENNVSQQQNLILEISKYEKEVKGRMKEQPSKNSNRSDKSVFLPVGIVPILDHKNLNGKSIVISFPQFDNRSYSIFIDSIKYQVSDFKPSWFKSENVHNDPSRDYISNLFIQTKKIDKIDKFITYLKTVICVITDNRKIQPNCKILDVTYNFSDFSTEIKYINNEEEVKSLKLKPFAYSENNSSDINYYIHAPIYKQDCYDKINADFKKLVLPKDNVGNSELKVDLTSALKNNPEFDNFEILKLILTEKSQWFYEKTSKYSAFIDHRVMFADAYIKDKKSNKCYLTAELIFMQKNDPIRGYIYKIISLGVPDLTLEYPCNLK